MIEYLLVMLIVLPSGRGSSGVDGLVHERMPTLELCQQIGERNQPENARRNKHNPFVCIPVAPLPAKKQSS